jgi:hypothetical protein
VLELRCPHGEFLERHVHRSGHAAATEFPILTNIEDADRAVPDESVELVDAYFGGATT